MGSLANSQLDGYVGGGGHGPPPGSYAYDYGG